MTKASLPGGRVGTARNSYFQSSRSPRYSVLFALPLLVGYELLTVVANGPAADRQIRNGADVMMSQFAYAIAGRNGPMLLMAAIIGISIFAVWRDLRRSNAGLRSGVFAGMLAESVALALAFGVVIGIVTAQLLGSLHLLMIQAPQTSPIAQMPWQTRLMLSLGAGLYEELLFRVILVSALATGARVLLGLGKKSSGFIAASVGALIFSAVHYIGPFGDPFQIQSFAFRALSGLAFSGIYLLRGFGITAWTHALYDAFLLL